jgi:hypothetical protein
MLHNTRDIITELSYTRSIKELSELKRINLWKYCDIESRMTHFGLPSVILYVYFVNVKQFRYRPGQASMISGD